jgi:hypothetical protein
MSVGLSGNAHSAAESRQLFLLPFSAAPVVIMGGETPPMKQGREQPESPPVENVKTGADVRSVPDEHEITRWLAACRGGDPVALEKLLPLVYDELHRLAMRFFSRERPDHTLQPTALVNEVYLRLVKQHEAAWQNRAQFFCRGRANDAADSGKPRPRETSGKKGRRRTAYHDGRKTRHRAAARCEPARAG